MNNYIVLLKEGNIWKKFNELPQEVQIDIIKGKLLDIYRQGLIRELAIDGEEYGSQDKKDLWREGKKWLVENSEVIWLCD